MMVRKTDHFSEEMASQLMGSATIAMISISEPDRIAEGVKDDRWAAVLRLQFHDIPKAWQNYVLFSEEQADQIIDFIEEHTDTCKAIYVHCAQGVSRSAAVARFVAERCGLQFDYWKGRLFNPHVYDVLRKRYRERTGVLLEDKFDEEVKKASKGKFGEGVNPNLRFTD